MADVSNDNKVNSIDFGLIRMRIIGMIKVFPRTATGYIFMYMAGYDRKMVKDSEKYGYIEDGWGTDPTISDQGLKTIANFELSKATIKAWGLGAYDANGNLIGIYPHYVFKNIGTDTNPKWVSDGGITFGYGHYVSKGEYDDVSSSERALVDKYAKGASILPSTTPSDGVPYRVPGSSAVPIAEVMRLYRVDLAGSQNAVNSFLNTHNIWLKQHQFDMLVSFSHNYGDGWWTMTPEKVLPKFIREGKGNYNPNDVIRIFEMHSNTERRIQEANIFNNGYPK